MKRKVISLILAAAMLGSILTGCGGGKDTSSGGGQEQSKEPAEDSAKPEADDSSEAEPAEAASSDTESGEGLSGTLSILSWYDETKAAPVLEAFKAKYPNVTVDFQYSPPVADYVEKLSTLLYSGAGPDIFYMALENREDLIKGNYVEDLSAEPYMANGIIPDSVKNTYGADGKAYSLAVDCWVGGIFYNKDIFDQVGITEEPKTWDELLAVCQKLKDAGIQPIMDNCQDAAVNFTAPLYGSEVKAGNANIVQDIYDGKATFKDTWTTPITMWKEGLIDNGYLTADMVGATSDEIVSAFATGQVAMILCGSWNLNTINTINPNMNYKCMGVPGTKETYYCGAINVGLCINSASQNKELAKAFLEFAASPEGLEAQYKGYGGFTIADGFTPDFQEEIKEAVANVKEGKYYIPMADWLSYTESLRLTYIQSLQDCMVGTITPEEAAARMDDKLAEVSAE